MTDLGAMAIYGLGMLVGITAMVVRMTERQQRKSGWILAGGTVVAALVIYAL